jgi:hypothetical protein
LSECQHYGTEFDTRQKSKEVCQLTRTEVQIGQSVYERAADRTAGVRFPADSRDSLLFCNVQTGSVAQPVSYAMGNGASYLGYNAAGT